MRQDLRSYLSAKQERTDIPEFISGDTVRVHYLITEGTKERVQAFEGVCIQKRGGGSTETFTVRKVTKGFGVERIFPLHSPRIQKLEVVRKGRVRRARLFYLRNLQGKAARIKERVSKKAK